MSFNLDNIVRDNIKKVKPYSSARDEFTGKADVYIDANENSLGSPLLKWYNRYPDPHQKELKVKISEIKSIPVSQIFLGNGSDECIDLLFRCFCEPAIDNVIICPPTYGMYEVSADINNIQLLRAPLTKDFQLDLELIEGMIDEKTKLIWICSPNNPTGNSLKYQDIEMLLNNFNGLVVIDEAYINFARQRSWTLNLADYPNLVILQTFSKAWGLAGLRLGMAFASADIIRLLDNIKPPYNISEATQELALKAVQQIDSVNEMTKELVSMRDELGKVFMQMPIVEKVYPSDANFLLVKMYGAEQIFEFLLSKAIVVRNRANVRFTEGCLRITIGSEKENTILVDALIAYMNEIKKKTT